MKAGYQPDPLQEVEAQQLMLEAAGRGADLMNPATDSNDQMLPGVEQIVNPQPVAKPAGLKTATA